MHKLNGKQFKIRNVQKLNSNNMFNGFWIAIGLEASGCVPFGRPQSSSRSSDICCRCISCEKCRKISRHIPRTVRRGSPNKIPSVSSSSSHRFAPVHCSAWFACCYAWIGHRNMWKTPECGPIWLLPIEISHRIVGSQLSAACTSSGAWLDTNLCEPKNEKNQR